MMTRFIYAFLERYRDAPAIIKAKAKVILVYNTVVLLAILFSLIIVQVIITPNLRNAAIDGAWILCLLLVLYALYRGAIRAASNGSIALNMIFLAVLGFMANVGPHPLFLLLQLGLMLATGIIYACLAADALYQPVLATVFSLAAVTVFYALRIPGAAAVGPAYFPISVLLTVYTALVIAGLNNYLALTIFQRAITLADQRAKENARKAEALTLAEARFRTIFDSVGETIFILDVNNGAIIDVNHTISSMYGHSREEAVRHSMADMSAGVPPYAHADVLARIAKACGDGPQHFEWHGKKRDGTLFWVEVNMRRTSIDGQDRVLVTVRDIEDRKQAAAQRAQLEERLRQVDKLEAIGQLAGGIAHDFNNQLTGILGYAELLEDKAPDDEYRAYAKSVRQAAEHSAELTKQLLAFARKGTFRTVLVDMNALVIEVIALIKRSIDKRIVITHTLRAMPPTVIGDPTQLQSALLNLALNARDAMPQGGELNFATEAVTLDDEFCAGHQGQLALGPFVRLHVSDTGVGMDKETQQRIFEPFFTTKGLGKGTGLGLAAVYGTIKSHRGAISCYSEPGRGTTFCIHLPLVEGAALLNEAAVSHIAGGRAVRILILDDEEMVRRLAADLLRLMGHKMIAFGRPSEAVDYYTAHWQEIDLVILDMMMPDMGGRDVFRAMRKVNPGVKALLSSGYSRDGEAQEILDEGVAGFLHKPFSMRDLQQQVATIVFGAEPGAPGR